MVHVIRRASVDLSLASDVDKQAVAIGELFCLFFQVMLLPPTIFFFPRWMKESSPKKKSTPKIAAKRRQREGRCWVVGSRSELGKRRESPAAPAAAVERKEGEQRGEPYAPHLGKRTAPCCCCSLLRQEKPFQHDIATTSTDTTRQVFRHNCEKELSSKSPPSTPPPSRRVCTREPRESQYVLLPALLPTHDIRIRTLYILCIHIYTCILHPSHQRQQSNLSSTPSLPPFRACEKTLAVSLLQHTHTPLVRLLRAEPPLLSPLLRRKKSSCVTGSGGTGILLFPEP